MARFALSHLEDYECLVLETLQKKQKLFVWKADFVQLSDLRKTQKNQALQEPGLSKTSDDSETPSERPRESRLDNNASVKDRIESWEVRNRDSPSSGKNRDASPPPRGTR